MANPSMDRVFLCAFTEDGTMPDTRPNGASDYFKVSDKVSVLLVPRAATSTNVCEIIGIGEENAGIVVRVSNYSGYSGYEDPDLWEKMKAWIKS